jgi:uncharacterized membrane protein YphA (DoxX/SURF4 family)
MSIALIILASALGLAAVGSAVGKLRRLPQVVEGMHAVGVRDSQLPVLATLEILGALGLLVGIWIVPIGVAAAACLTLYFLGALIAHLRAKGPLKEMLPPVVLLLLALATTVLELAR